MKELSSLFLLKNALGSKMRKGFRNFCNDDGSTSTLDQHNIFETTGRRRRESSNCTVTTSQQLVDDSSCLDDSCDGTSLGGGGHMRGNGGKQPTLEEMILQLELEEKMARSSRSKLDDYGEIQHRMSCVNSSDILRSARNALNQYPRFSLDGKDAMYRSSFRSLAPATAAARKSNYEFRSKFYGDRLCLNIDRSSKARSTRLPLSPTVAGENVVWCKPGVVAKLMGLEAMPIPVNMIKRSREKLSAIIKRQSLRRADQKHEMDRKRLLLIMAETKHAGGGGGGGIKRGSSTNTMASCSSTSTTTGPGYCGVMNPVAAELADEEVGWPMRRFF